MIYAVGVDISIAFRKDKYYFRYKGVDFKYVPHYKNGETDDMVCKISVGSSQPAMYELITEFLAAFAFANNAKVIVHSGIASNVNAKISDTNIHFSLKRSINVDEGMDEFYYISLLRTPEQIQLARLYREAFSSNNVYLKILFFWHCLVYPSTKGSKAVKYIEESIRHSIAHIVRESRDGVNLKLDSWEQMRHLYCIERFMQVIAKYRLENEYAMKASNDTNIFRYISENEL